MEDVARDAPRPAGSARRAGHLGRIAPLLVWMVVIFVGSSIPGRAIPESVFFSYDKLLHGLEYAILGAVACHAAGGRRGAVLLGGLVALIYGATDELHQTFVSGRHGDVYDWIADTVGGTLGALTWRFVLARRRRDAL